MKQVYSGIATVIAIGLLSGCGLYIHDPSLKESAEATRTLVSESDLSKQINGVLTGAADLAKRQEAAVVNSTSCGVTSNSCGSCSQTSWRKPPSPAAMPASPT